MRDFGSRIDIERRGVLDTERANRLKDRVSVALENSDALFAVPFPSARSRGARPAVK